MRQLLILAFALAICLATQSCRRELYKRPVTIDKFEFTNTAGQKYEEQFRKVNRYFVNRIKILEEEKQSFKIDTLAGKRYRKYNHTLVASLDTLNLNGRPGVYYQLYLRPNSGIGKVKGNVQEDKYNELKLFSPGKLFLQHTAQYYTDSIVSGPFRRFIKAYELYKPQNQALPNSISIAIERINFPKGFSKRQKRCLTYLINSSVVQMQQNFNNKNYSIGTFNYFQNFDSQTPTQPADCKIYVDVMDDPASNKITVQFSNDGIELEKWWGTKVTFNRTNFLEGHTYEASYTVPSMASGYVQAVWLAKRKQVQSAKSEEN